MPRERRRSRSPGRHRGSRRSRSPSRTRDTSSRATRRRSRTPPRRASRERRGRETRPANERRRRSRSPPAHAHRARSSTRSPSPAATADHAKTGPTEQELQTMTEDEQMMALMGFGGFDTTKDKAVAGNTAGAANVKKQRKFRQYMNRRGGFNRLLDKQ
ncbi:hypothetical protein H4R19_001529 [Coemansia spiralis]|nr:hypothetical protein H4R19_001529 [Coemansia spiralis]